MEQEVPYNSVALIVGVTSMVGSSLAEALKKTQALGGPWKVYGTARQSLPPCFPFSTIDHFISLDATNYEDTMLKLCPLSPQITHLFWLAVQFQENEEANISFNTAMLKNVIEILLKSSPASPLRHVTLQTGTKHYMGPIDDPLVKTTLIPHEPPFDEAMPRLPYQNFHYSLEDLVASYSSYFSYSIHRSSIIMGMSSRGFANAPLTLFIYATICKYEGLKFRYPGSKYTWEHFCDMSDARLLAEQQIWAGVTAKARNQAFNCTNGDFFTWKSLWKVLCEIFDLQFFEPFDDPESEKFDLVKEMRGRDKVWEAIVEQYGLYKTRLNDVTNFAILDTVLHFQIQHVCSMNKSREFGFLGHVNTLKSIRMWVAKLRDMKLIP